ncbi:MAG: glycosyltransferase family 2 protein [Bacteroidia bacterium]
MIDLSVIIPIYNEEGNIKLLHERLTEVVQQMPIDSYEFIFVNDGSRDTSMALLMELAQRDEHVKYIDFSRNFGHQIAVSAGLDATRGEAVVIIDADLQDPPELILEMYTKYKEGFEVVYAKRRKRQGESFFKKITAKLFYRTLARITSLDIPLDTGDFRLMDHKIVNILNQMPEQNKFLRGQISWIGFNQTYVEYDRASRHAGSTGYPISKMLRFALDGITAFSDFPLRLATISGFVVSVIAFLLMIYALVSRLVWQDYQPGWASQMIAMLFIGGIQLLSIGVIGEYVNRIAANVRNRPLYVVRDSNVKKEEEE